MIAERAADLIRFGDLLAVEPDGAAMQSPNTDYDYQTNNNNNLDSDYTDYDHGQRQQQQPFASMRRVVSSPSAAMAAAVMTAGNGTRYIKTNKLPA